MSTTTPSHHRRLTSTSSLRLRPSIVEGRVARESAVANGLVNHRHMAVYAGAGGAPPTLASYRHVDDSTPSKVWTLTSACTLSDVVCRQLRVRPDHRSMIYTVARSAYTTVDMVRPAPPRPTLAQPLPAQTRRPASQQLLWL